MHRKTCYRCMTNQDISAFNKDSRISDGHRSWCRQCEADYRDSVRDRRRASDRARYRRQRPRRTILTITEEQQGA